MIFPVIDAHVHVWDPARARYDWLGAQHAPVDRRMDFDEVQPQLVQTGVAGAVLVQAADNVEDTAVMLKAAAEHSEILGVVGYLPLDEPATTAQVLAGWESIPVLVGARVLIHDRADPDWLLGREVGVSLGLLAAAGMPFDVVAVLPRHLEVVLELSRRHPELTMIIDHLGKPPVEVDDGGRWAALIAEVARNPRVFAKVSGLYSATGDLSAWTTTSIRPAVEHALEHFGAARLLYGGDWPISVLAGGYERVWSGMQPILDDLTADDRERILGRTAVEVYGLTVPAQGETANAA